MTKPQATNPRWLTWKRAGAPKPSAEFPRAGAFSLWIQAQWREFEAHRKDRVADHERGIWRAQHADAFDAWLLKQYPIPAKENP